MKKLRGFAHNRAFMQTRYQLIKITVHEHSIVRTEDDVSNILSFMQDEDRNL